MNARKSVIWKQVNARTLQAVGLENRLHCNMPTAACIEVPNYMHYLIRIQFLWGRANI